MAVVEEPATEISIPGCSADLPWRKEPLPLVQISSAKCSQEPSGCQPLCALTIPNVLLCKWFYDNEPNLVRALNEAITGNCVAISESCQRIKLRLQVLCRKTASQY